MDLTILLQYSPFFIEAKVRSPYPIRSRSNAVVHVLILYSPEQLQKMGILPSPPSAVKPASTTKRKSGPDFGDLKPLKPTGGAGFSAFRDTPRKASKQKNKAAVVKNDSDMDDSDEDLADDEGPTLPKVEDVEGHGISGEMLSPEDARRQGELAEGVQKIKVRPSATAPSSSSCSPTCFS